MPTYVYRREDGSTFEIEQRITAEALETCPDTGQKVERIITGSAGLIFKGSGFYLTDYVRNDKGSGSKPTSAGESSASEGSSSEGSAAGSSASSGENSGASASAGGSKDSGSGTNASSNT